MTWHTQLEKKHPYKAERPQIHDTMQAIRQQEETEIKRKNYLLKCIDLFLQGTFSNKSEINRGQSPFIANLIICYCVTNWFVMEIVSSHIQRSQKKIHVHVPHCMCVDQCLILNAVWTVHYVSYLLISGCNVYHISSALLIPL